MAHLQEMDYLKQGIGLRAYGQLDPLVEYKQEAYKAFKILTEGLYEDFLRTFLRLQMAVEQPLPEQKSALSGKVAYSNPEGNLDAKERAQAPAPNPSKAAAKAKGMPFRRVVVKHALRNAMNPVVTSASGWLASLLAGAVFVEYVFDWKGMGIVIVDGLEKYDFPVVMGAILFVCLLLVVINIVVDILYGVLDPRVRIDR